MTAVILFTKNEDKTIGKVIDDLKDFLKQISDLKTKLFLCDDSTDKTVKIAKDRGVEIIPGSGKGLGWSYYLALYVVSALYKGTVSDKEQTGGYFDSIITIDGDGQTDLSELPLFYEEFKKGHDLVVGSRFLRKRFHISIIIP